MADRYDLDRDRDRDREQRGREESDRGREWNRESGNERWGELRREEHRERRPYGQSGYEGRENRPYNEYTSDFGERGDWGRQGAWGTYGNRPDYNRENWRDERSYEGRQDPSDRGRTERNDWGRESGWSQRAGYGGYSGGMGTYGGGFGTYGERGRYTGRGPKGWQRSDERIREDINEHLTQHPDIDASEIEVQVRSCEVTLTGTVEDRNAKRLAEDIAERTSGVKDVHNQIRVQQQPGLLQGANTGSSRQGTTEATSQQPGSTQGTGNRRT